MSTTITQAVFDALPRLIGQKPSGTTIYQAINFVQSMISRRLLYRRFDMLVAAETTWVVTPGNQYYNLPTGFVSLRENPFDLNMVGDDYYDDFNYGDYYLLVDLGRSSRGIQPLSRQRSSYANRTCQTPEAYEILGQQIVFYPALNSSVTSVSVKARFYSLPTPVSGPKQVDPITHATTDVVLPYNGMFDQVFFQGIPRVVAKGLGVIQADPDFEAFLRSEVDCIVDARNDPAPSRRMKRSNYL
jgi:hypothetical protein